MTVYEVVLTYDSPSGAMLNVLHYDITGDEPFDFQDMADGFKISFVAGLASIIAPAVSFTGLNIRLDVLGSVGQFFAFTGGEAPGTATDNQFISQAAGLVQKLAGNLVRPNKGRAYQGGITSEGVTNLAVWTPAVESALAIFWADVITVNFAGPSVAQMQIKASNPLAPNTVPYNPVNSVLVQGIPRTQRRRVRGVGI